MASRVNTDCRDRGEFARAARVLMLLLPLAVPILACGMTFPQSTRTPFPTTSSTFQLYSPTDAVLPTLTPAPPDTTIAVGGGDCTPRAEWTAMYTIVAGDTLSGLAQQIGSTADEIAAGNCLADANSISVGLVLRLPTTIQLLPSAEKRIQFPIGATSVRVQGQVAAGSVDKWVLDAQVGQTMTVQLSVTTGQGVLIVSGADGAILQSDLAAASSFSSVLPKTQDYFIDVRGNPDSTSPYTFMVTIPPLSAASQ